MMRVEAKLRVVGILGVLGVIAGASGAHGSWADALTEAGRLDEWKTAVLYHLLHVIALLGVIAIEQWGANSALRWAFRFLLTGCLIFCGSLYLLSATNLGWLGAITPIGGLFLIAGWGALCFMRRA